jgi:hypothetical protein
VHPSLEDAQLRLNRADEHLAALDDERGTYLVDARKRILGRFERETSQYVLYIEGQPPRAWSILVSEIVHHIHSTLDNLVCALAAHRGTTVTNDHSFYVCLTPGSWKSSRARNSRKGLSAADKKIIKRFQPFERSGESPESDPLAQITWLSNRDKHRSLHTAFTSVQPGFFFPLPEKLPGPTEIVDCEILMLQFTAAWNPERSETEVLRALIRQTGPNPQMRMEDHPGLDVALTDGEKVLAFDNLRSIRADTEGIVIALAPQFS